MAKKKAAEEEVTQQTEVCEETASQPEDNQNDNCENEKIEALQKQLTEEKEKYLRLAAEYDNFRKRSQREKESAYGDARAQTVTQILPVIDNFERAAKNTDASMEDYTKGVVMTFDRLMDIFGKLGVEAYGEPGDEFNPEIHSAVMHVEDEELGENVLAEVFQKGYRLGDRILRHAMVKVAN